MGRIIRSRKIALILAGVLVIGVLSGCQSGTNAGTEEGYSEEATNNNSDKNNSDNNNSDSGTGDQESSDKESSDKDSDNKDSNNKDSNTEKSGDEGESQYVIPEVTMEKYDIPDTEDFQFVKDMKIGFSLGNTFDAFVDGSSLKDDMDTETAWQSNVTVEQNIKDFHAAGFETVRIPVSWHNHFTDDDYTINEKWMARVHEVVDWAINDGMYVIINIHHDNHEAANAFYPDSEHLEQSKHYIERIWTQLSEEFKDYDDKLIFEAMNEPRLVDTEYEWWLKNSADECKDAVKCINVLNQTFVDTVRATGGNNATRYLMCPGYDASADGALNSGFVLPEDPTNEAESSGTPEGNDVGNRLLVSVHAYTPYDFALDINGTSHFDASKKNCTADIDTFMDKLYTKFIAQGVPVVIGEFGALAKKNIKKEDNVQERVDYSAYYIAAARARGMTCLWWDNNSFSGKGENFGLYYRTGCYFVYQDIVDALMKYAE